MSAEVLESRTLLSAVTFEYNSLNVTLDGSDSAVFQLSGGNVGVLINGTSAGPSAPVGDVYYISVSGGEGANYIDLNAVTSANGFSSLYYISIDGYGGDDTIIGTGLDDQINGGDGNDSILAGAGSDTVYGNNGADTIFGEAGFDELSGDSGTDALYGGDDDDTLWSGSGYPYDEGDLLDGEAGCNLIDGNDDCAGNDSMTGGGDDDSMTGGDGSGTDTLTDGTGQDSLGDADLVFGKLVGVGWEGGNLDFVLEVTTSSGESVDHIEIDLDRDGTSDLYSMDYNQSTGAFLILDSDTLGLLGDPPGEDGTYTATAIAFLSNGDAESQDFTVTVGQVLPIISIDYPVDLLLPGDAFYPTITVTETGPDTIQSVVVDWGDGTTDFFTGSPGTISHTYTAASVYTLTVSATSEDGTSTKTREVEVGDVAPNPPDDRPVIVDANVVINPDNTATITLNATYPDGTPITDPNAVEWDLDLDGEFDDATGLTATVPYSIDSDYPYSAAVRVTDASGATRSALFGFVGSGQVTPQGPTIHTYRAEFVKATKAFPQNWQVHHTLPVVRHTFKDGTKENILADRFWKERGINVNDLQYLRGVHPTHHLELNHLQTAFWQQMLDEMKKNPPGNVNPDTIDLVFVYRNVDLDRVIDFAQSIEADSEHSKKWITAGSDWFGRKSRIVRRTNDFFKNDLAKWIKGKADRYQRVGITLNRIAVFMLFYESASAAASIANHNATQLARWRGLEINYRAGLEELQEKGRLSANRAHQIRQAWKEYSLSINLPEDTVDAVDIFVAAYIDANLEP